VKARDAKTGDWLFPDENGGPIGGRLADMVRAHLLFAGVIGTSAKTMA
jgi:hypothetical protein